MNNLQIAWAVLMAANAFLVLPGFALYSSRSYRASSIGEVLTLTGILVMLGVLVYAVAQMFLCAFGG